MDHAASPPRFIRICVACAASHLDAGAPASKGSHHFELELVESDAARYQRFSGVASPPWRLAARLALDPDGCVSAIRIAALNTRGTGRDESDEVLYRKRDVTRRSRRSGSHT